MSGSSRAVLAGTALLAVFLAGACRSSEPEDIETTQRVSVETRPARRGAIRGVITATGTIKPAPDAEQLVMAPQAARIAELPKAAGDVVHKGDLLVRFEIPSLDADAAAKHSDLERAKARLDNALASEERIRGLFERGIAARKEVEDAQRELAEAKAGLTEAESGRHAAGELAGRQVVRARFDGVVAKRTRNPGDLVEAGGTDPILRVIDPRALQVEAGVPVAEIAAVEVGASARILAPAPPASQGADPPRVLESSTVVSRPASVDPATGMALVRLSLGSASLLPDGTPVGVEILGSEHRNAVVVPAAAVVREGTSAFVFTVDAGSHAHRMPVSLGVSSRDEVEVLSGLSGDERVVVRGHHALPDGSIVAAEP
jgi:RND family efflux transporter MFP subunit